MVTGGFSARCDGHHVGVGLESVGGEVDRGAAFGYAR